MPDKNDDFYKQLRQKVHRWAGSKEGRHSKYTEYILLAPDLFHLLVRLSLDKEVPVKEKAKLAGAIAYFLSPIDLLPEWLVGPIGYLDDVGLAVFVVHSILQNTEEEIVTRHWAGDADLLETVQGFMAKADQMLGAGLWGRIKDLVEKPGRSRPSSPKPKKAEPARSDAARATERGILSPKEKQPARSEDADAAEGKKATKKVTKKATKKTAAKKATGKKPTTKASKVGTTTKRPTAKKSGAKSSGQES